MPGVITSTYSESATTLADVDLESFRSSKSRISEKSESTWSSETSQCSASVAHVMKESVSDSTHTETDADTDTNSNSDIHAHAHVADSLRHVRWRWPFLISLAASLVLASCIAIYCAFGLTSSPSSSRARARFGLLAPLIAALLTVLHHLLLTFILIFLRTNNANASLTRYTGATGSRSQQLLSMFMTRHASRWCVGVLWLLWMVGMIVTAFCAPVLKTWEVAVVAILCGFECAILGVFYAECTKLEARI